MRMTKINPCMPIGAQQAQQEGKKTPKPWTEWSSWQLAYLNTHWTSKDKKITKEFAAVESVAITGISLAH